MANQMGMQLAVVALRELRRHVPERVHLMPTSA
jgi:hypothetical protein